MSALLLNIHKFLDPPGSDVAMVTGNCDYYHYGCDGVDDRGWGCGYRTLQTLCSWVRRQLCEHGSTPAEVPSIPAIQDALVTMQDKPPLFCGSREWIGSVEVSLCVDFFFQVPCRVVHIAQASKLLDYIEQIAQHFLQVGSPIMMGGDTDASSKGIMGVCRDPPSLLVVDPHYYGPPVTRDVLQQNNWVRWVPVHEFCKDSFYNICMPLYKQTS